MELERPLDLKAHFLYDISMERKEIKITGKRKAI
jgi:hypothetical protein